MADERPAPFAGALTGLAASLFYAPYDIVGAKFLWWTWHDSDPRIANRILGAPIGGTMWVLTFTAAFAWLVGRVVDRDPAVSNATFAKGIALVCGLSTLLMIVEMTPLQVLDGGMPGIRGLVAVVALFAWIAWRGLRRAPPARDCTQRVARRRTACCSSRRSRTSRRSWSSWRRSIRGPTRARAFTRPTARVTSPRPTSPGRVATSTFCAEDFDEDFGFDCTPGVPADGAQWYTVCGRPYTSFARWLLGVSVLGIAGTLLYGYLLGSRRPAT